MPQVKICRLDGNRFEHVTADFFAAFKKPSAISLQRNNIASLPRNIFDGIKGKVKNLDFRNQRNNLLRCVPPQIMLHKNIKPKF